MPPFRFTGSFDPTGDQPQAIEKLADGLASGKRFQTLLGVTGDGQDVTMAKVIEQSSARRWCIAHNKTLAAQLCAEFRSSSPRTPSNTSSPTTTTTSPKPTSRADTYIEKDSAINEEIDRLRHAATRRC